MRLISRPACAASLRQRCTSFSSSSSSGESFFSGWRSMPGTSPATSQLDWLISMTAISVLSWSKAVRDRLRSFDCGMGHSIGLRDSAEGDMPSPLAPYHLVAVVAERDGPLTLGCPDPAQDRLQADAVLVRGPDLDRRVRVLGRFLGNDRGQLFLNASRSSGVAEAGWRGRGFCTDQSIALSASQPR